MYKYWLLGFVSAFLLLNCSSVPLKLHCEEIRSRMERDQSPDEYRFAKQELEECENQLKEARIQDSLKVEHLHETFTPSDSLLGSDTTRTKP